MQYKYVYACIYYLDGFMIEVIENSSSLVWIVLYRALPYIERRKFAYHNNGRLCHRR